MAQYQLTVDGDLLAGLFTRSEAMAELVEQVLNQLLAAQVTEQLQAEPYERTGERQGYRNGYRERALTTRFGSLVLEVPRIRGGALQTEVFARYQRSEQALLVTLVEMVVSGVSTRKVKAVTEELCGTEISRSTVSDLCKRLDPIVQAWNERDLAAQTYPFILVDALVIRVRKDGRVRQQSVLIATGINALGYREILGMQLGDSEAEATWGASSPGSRAAGSPGSISWCPMITPGWSKRCSCSSRAPVGNAAKRMPPGISAMPAPRPSGRSSIPACGCSSPRRICPPPGACSPMCCTTSRPGLPRRWRSWRRRLTI